MSSQNQAYDTRNVQWIEIIELKTLIVAVTAKYIIARYIIDTHNGCNTHNGSNNSFIGSKNYINAYHNTEWNLTKDKKDCTSKSLLDCTSSHNTNTYI